MSSSLAGRAAVNHAAIRPERDRRRPLGALNVFWKLSEMTADPGPTYDFGPFRLEVRERRLLREGRAVPLRTKVFDTLRVLVEHSGRLLTKHELMQIIWPDTVVEENNLNHNISTLRRALGEQVTGQRYIETVPRVGYRFVADVTEFVGRRCGPQSGAASRARAQPAPGNPLLHDERRHPHRLFDGRQRSAAGQGGQLAQPSRIRVGKSGLETLD